MKEELLKDLKTEYSKKLEEKEKKDKDLAIFINRKAILENSTLVRDYIDLCKRINDVKEEIYTVDEIFSDTLYDYLNKGLVDDTNNIYLHAGSFINEYGFERKVENDSLMAEFDKYINIESFESIDIPSEDKEAFENNNKILNIESDLPLKYLLYDLRDQFVKDSMRDGQEVACKKILSRNKKNL